MRKHVRLVNDTVYANDGASSEIAGMSELDDLASGAIAVLDLDGALLSDPSTSIVLTEEINIVTGGLPGTGLFKPTLAEMVKESYIAPVNKVINVGSNGSSGDLLLTTPFVDLTSIGVIVSPVFREDGDRSFPRYDVALTSNMTLSAALDALVTKINADPKSLVTAAKNTQSTNYGLKFTGKGRNFNISLQGELAAETIVVTTPYKKGFGTQALIQELFDDNSAITGDRDGLKARKVYTGVTVPATTYHVYTLNWYTDRHQMINEARPQMKQNVFVVPTTSTAVIADMDALLAAINVNTTSLLASVTANTADIATNAADIDVLEGA